MMWSPYICTAGSNVSEIKMAVTGEVRVVVQNKDHYTVAEHKADSEEYSHPRELAGRSALASWQPSCLMASELCVCQASDHPSCYTRVISSIVAYTSATDAGRCKHCNLTENSLPPVQDVLLVFVNVFVHCLDEIRYKLRNFPQKKILLWMTTTHFDVAHYTIDIPTWRIFLDIHQSIQLTLMLMKSCT